jgi:hypothetical protein
MALKVLKIAVALLSTIHQVKKKILVGEISLACIITHQNVCCVFTMKNIRNKTTVRIIIRIIMLEIGIKYQPISNLPTYILPC